MLSPFTARDLAHLSASRFSGISVLVSLIGAFALSATVLAAERRSPWQKHNVAPWSGRARFPRTIMPPRLLAIWRSLPGNCPIRFCNSVLTICRSTVPIASA
jgi:hypothetical protein